MALRPAPPVLVAELFPEALDALLSLLRSLGPGDWSRPATPRWSVKDVALHLLGGELGILSRKRDREGGGGAPFASFDDLAAFINRLNATWLDATRRLSPRVVVDLLALGGAQACDYFRSLDPFAIGDPVDWAGPDPAPVWLDVAREYTERWHHQQQIRVATGRPGLDSPRFTAPVIAAFVRALPRTFRDAAAPEGQSVTLTVSGPAGGRWSVRREGAGWALHEGAPEAPNAELVLDQETCWRLFCKGVSREAARARAELRGDLALAARVLDTIAVIA